MPNKNEHRSLFNSRWFYRIIALILSILLFIYVNGGRLESTHQTEQSTENASLTSTKKKTITMPLDLTVDSDRYIVSGYPEKVKVTISGPAALVTATSNTQNFKVYADLSSLSPGRHKVSVKETGLNKDLTHRIVPKSVTVLIQSRKTKTMPVKVRVNSGGVASNYKVGKATASVSDVQITGAVDEINKVDHVIAAVELTKKNTTDVSKQVTLQAVDKSGNTVNVVVTPQTATVKVPISKKGSSSSSSSGSSESQAESNSSNGATSSKQNNTSTSDGSSSESSINSSSSTESSSSGSSSD